jgi:hypothetical protein
MPGTILIGFLVKSKKELDHLENKIGIDDLW